jgi:hypothetical protein
MITGAAPSQRTAEIAPDAAVELAAGAWITRSASVERIEARCRQVGAGLA